MKKRVLSKNYVIKGKSSVGFMFSSLCGSKYLNPAAFNIWKYFVTQKTALIFGDKFYRVLDWSISRDYFN